MKPNKDYSIISWIQDIELPAPFISYIYRTVQRKFAIELSEYNIGWGHFAILMALNEMEGCSQERLALSRGYDKTMIAKSVVKLEKEGLIYRLKDPDDKRINNIHLTERAREILPEIISIGLGINKKIFKDFDEKESEVIIEYLRKIAINVSRM